MQELLLYLLQLVQALRFENGAETRKKRKVVEEDDSGLSQFLIDRSVANPLLGTSFHWYLMIECDTRSLVGKAYAKVAFRFMQKLSEVSPCQSPERGNRLILDGERHCRTRHTPTPRRIGRVAISTSQGNPSFKRWTIEKD